MPNSLRCRLKKFKYQGLITEKECERLISALDKVDIIDEIETVIDKGIEAHKSMKWLGEYDRGFNAGMEHAKYIIGLVKGVV